MLNDFQKLFSDFPDEESRSKLHKTILGILQFYTEYEVKHKTQNYELLNKYCEKNQIVIAGDSIAELYPASELLNEYLKSIGKSVYNRGIGGEISQHFSERLESNIIPLNPDYMLIIIGTNDLSQGVPSEEIIGNLSTAVDLIQTKSSGTRLLLSSLLPVNATLPDTISKFVVGVRTNEAIKKLNIAIKNLTIQKGIAYVNVFEALIDQAGNLEPDCTMDGLHPNLKGYEIITKTILSALSDYPVNSKTNELHS
jgi:lysophospholipase L1-like esterase